MNKNSPHMTKTRKPWDRFNDLVEIDIATNGAPKDSFGRSMKKKEQKDQGMHDKNRPHLGLHLSHI